MAIYGGISQKTAISILATMRTCGSHNKKTTHMALYWKILWEELTVSENCCNVY
jgi:hypothetical protein